MKIFEWSEDFFLTLLPTAFYDFLSYGGRIFIPHPRKQCYNYLIDLNLVHIINGIKQLRIQNFRKFATLFFRDMTS